MSAILRTCTTCRREFEVFGARFCPMCGAVIRRATEEAAPAAPAADPPTMLSLPRGGLDLPERSDDFPTTVLDADFDDRLAERRTRRARLLVLASASLAGATMVAALVWSVGRSGAEHPAVAAAPAPAAPPAAEVEPARSAEAAPEPEPARARPTPRRAARKAPAGAQKSRPQPQKPRADLDDEIARLSGLAVGADRSEDAPSATAGVPGDVPPPSGEVAGDDADEIDRGSDGAAATPADPGIDDLPRDADAPSSESTPSAADEPAPPAADEPPPAPAGDGPAPTVEESHADEGADEDEADAEADVDAQRAVFFVNLGNAHLEAGRVDAAATSFARALSIDPTNEDALRGLERTRQTDQ